MTHTIVIGGGVAGLAVATLLAHEGHHVRLLEKNERVGGRIGVFEQAGFRFDTGPSWYLMPGVFDHFFRLLGTSTAEQLDLRRLDPGYQIFGEPDFSEDGSGEDGSGGANHDEANHTARASDGRVREVRIPAGAEQIIATFDRIEPGSGDRLRTYLRSARRAEQMAERYFLYNPFTRLRSLLAPDVLRSAPQLASLLGVSLERHIAKRFANPLLRQVLGYHSVFIGTDPSRAPAMYHLMSALDLDEGVEYPMGGFWSFIERLEALARAAGVDIVTGAEVTEIRTRRDQGRLAVSGVRWAGGDGQERFEHAHYVVSAADLHHTETKLVPPGARTYPQKWWRKRQSGPGAVIAMLGVDGELPQLEHHSLFFTRDWTANFDAIFGKRPNVPRPASMYVCRQSATDPAAAPRGYENLFLLIPVPAQISIGSGGPDGLGDAVVERTVDAAIRQIETWANVPALADRIVLRRTMGPADFARDYYSWQGGMLGPSHILRQSAFFRAQNQSKKVDGLYYAGATTAPGIGVPMCLISAELVLKRIRGDHSAGPLPDLPIREAVESR